jgi:hypothetical protein
MIMEATVLPQADNAKKVIVTAIPANIQKAYGIRVREEIKKHFSQSFGKLCS